MKNWTIVIGLIFTSTLSSLSAQSEEKEKVILVLGSGGSRGIAHVGVIEELEQMGVVPDIIVGCSAGAVIGALYAEHRDIGRVKEILMELKYDDLVDFSLFQQSAISTREKVENFLEEHLTARDFSSLEVQFFAVAVDLNKGEPVYFSEGELLPAILASSALPGLYPPYLMDGQVYVDGGICDPLPIGFARKLEKNALIIASDISPSLDGFEADDIAQTVRKAFEVIYHRLSFYEKDQADILLEMDFLGDTSPIEDGSNPKFYEQGKQVTREHSEEILKRVSQQK